MMRNAHIIAKSKSKEEDLGYMSDMALELAQMAEDSGQSTLAYLFRMAALEASTADTVMTDHDDFARPLFIRPPGPVEIAVEPGANRLDQQTARGALDRGKTFEPQDIVLGDEVLDAFEQLLAIGDRPQRHGEGDEVVVIMLHLAFHLVMGEAVMHVVFGCRSDTEQSGHVECAMLRRHQLGAFADLALEIA